MRGFAIALLAGLLAVTAPPASALCVEDGEGGCTAGTYSFTIDLDEEGCADANATLCVVDADGNLSQAPNSALWNLTIRNHASSPVTFEVFAISFTDDPVSDDGTRERSRAVLLATIEAAAGETVRLDQVEVDQTVAAVRLQAMADDGRQGELDQDVMNFQILAVGGIVDEEPQGDLDDDVPADGEDEADADSGSKDSPGLPLALLVVGCLAAVLLARRLK
jgi:hypothetical protein